MADENTQVAPVAGAEENATQENKGFTYYFSDPDSANAEMHHVVITLPYELPELPWHWHIEKPDDSLKDPVWDLKVNGWVENSKDGQAAILQEATKKLEELDKKSAELDQANDKVDQAIKSMQEVQAQSSKQNLALMKSFTEQTQNTNQILGAMQKTLAMVTKAVGANANNATPANPTTDTKPADQATDKQ
ncbi:hypothetical protein [Lactobacillus crispatus]|uniref:hypothetical protein n=2 Tax=Lactobacillus crispatus TaxID=47770 RepID=UPI0018DBF57F|nr:hypothetical protein [Lactobacillus crispatus]MBH9539006.1 hypothetical protein [Lactobacillus crispatus]MCZ3559131.1 hypothetical protein [Lactobacillus crispatus]MCZ3561242.1 hypothetical protein [Lactobacillus crispatus]MCZ3563394.1 hypothetical protein [Lactobacillus crispatus]MCZ3565442.1 hypothetical protein [Lactobacillus crispatus]